MNGLLLVSFGFYWIRILAQTLAFDGYLARIRKSNLEKNTFSNDQSYFAFAFFSKIDRKVLLGISVNEGLLCYYKRLLKL